MAEFTSRWLASPSADDRGSDKTDEGPSGTSGTRTNGEISTDEVLSRVPSQTTDTLLSAIDGLSQIQGGHIPPAGCIASRYACPVLGPCDRHRVGRPCLVADLRREDAAA